MERVGSIIKKPAKQKENRIHTPEQLFVYELRVEYGETAKAGVGSFGYYMRFIKGVGLPRAQQMATEARNGREPKRLFWWMIGKQLRKE